MIGVCEYRYAGEWQILVGPRWPAEDRRENNFRHSSGQKKLFSHGWTRMKHA